MPLDPADTMSTPTTAPAAQSGTSANTTPVPVANTVAAVAVKLPPFWTQDPAAWFSYSEATFNIRNITSSRTKYDYVVTSLPYEMIYEIKDIIASPPAADPYENLKKSLIARTAISERDRLRQLLSKEDLGDRKPSQLLRHMKSLLGAKMADFDTKLLRELFTQRLPSDIQLVLAAASPETQLESLAGIADRVMEVNKNSICAVSVKKSNPNTTTTLTEVLTRIDDLTKKVEDLATEVHRNKSQQHYRPRSQSRQARNSSPNKKRKDWCYFHNRFGDKAFKCESPCTHPGNDKSE